VDGVGHWEGAAKDNDFLIFSDPAKQEGGRVGKDQIIKHSNQTLFLFVFCDFWGRCFFFRGGLMIIKQSIQKLFRDIEKLGSYLV